MSLFGDVLGFVAGERANSSAKSAAREKIGADRYNYKRRHQWEVQDLRKAGLNPVLSALNGAPSLPGAGQAQVFNPADSMASMSNAMNTAKLVKAQTKNLEAQARKTDIEANIRDADTPLAELKEDVVEEVADTIHSAKGLASKAANFGKTVAKNPKGYFKRLYKANKYWGSKAYHGSAKWLGSKVKKFYQ